VDVILFMVLAALAVVGGAVVILHRNPIKSALALIVVMVALALLYLSLSASFLAIIQILVYAGAVMVLFLFVLFLLNVGVESPFAALRRRRIIAVLVGSLMGFVLAGLVVVRAGGILGRSAPAVGSEFGSIESAGIVLFTRYLLPFELLSILLLIAIIGAVTAARPRWPGATLSGETAPDEISGEEPL
jgi:NADH-quinone oxidoreductase subunit J